MSGRAYYNEFDPKAAQWLRNLIAAGLLPGGDVDERSIEDVTPNDLRGYVQCHFFAGIGGWPLALALAGWPASRPVWTGSCPCQPFSAAGKGAGFADERHLWPAWQHLIAQCRPPVIFGEQVASAAVGPWLDLVHADLEGMGYAFGGIAFPAAGVGAPHIRDRTYWVADTDHAGLEGRALSAERATQCLAGPGRMAGRLAHAYGGNPGAERQQRSGEQRQQPQDGGAGGVADACCAGSLPSALAGVHRGEDGPGTRDGEPQRQGAAGWMADPTRGGRREEHAHAGRGGSRDSAQRLAAGSVHGRGDLRPGPTNGQWAAADWLGCTDGKWRPVEPGAFPLAHGIPGRVVRLRAYGNAIVPAQAAEFIRAWAEARGLTLAGTVQQVAA